MISLSYSGSLSPYAGPAPRLVGNLTIRVDHVDDLVFVAPMHKSLLGKQPLLEGTPGLSTGAL